MSDSVMATPFMEFGGVRASNFLMTGVAAFIGSRVSNQRTTAALAASAHRLLGYKTQQGSPACRLRSVRRAVVDGWHSMQRLWRRVALQ